jgi:hypothetical protein
MTDLTRPYELTFEARPQYLYAQVKADTITEQIAAGYLREVADKCRELECDRLLLHRDIPEMLATGTLFFVAADFQKMISGIRTAFVNPHLSNRNELDFAVTVGTNRGADYAVFDNDADAEAWLLRSLPHLPDD